MTVTFRGLDSFVGRISRIHRQSINEHSLRRNPPSTHIVAAGYVIGPRSCADPMT
jgi:hypothetical protein